VKSDGRDAIATLPAKSLSSNERLALQEGAVVQVLVSSIDGSNIEVRLKNAILTNPIISNNNIQSSNPRNNEQQLNGKPSSSQMKRKANKQNNKVTKPPGIDIKSLRSGMQLDGIASTIEPYAAFINTNVYRPGKGGTYLPVNGLLHSNDISETYMLPKNKKDMNDKKDNSKRLVIEQGLPLTVYVKEVWKNSG
jgi:hypothetical protein